MIGCKAGLKIVCPSEVNRTTSVESENILITLFSTLLKGFEIFPNLHLVHANTSQERGGLQVPPPPTLLLPLAPLELRTRQKSIFFKASVVLINTSQLTVQASLNLETPCMAHDLKWQPLSTPPIIQGWVIK